MVIYREEVYGRRKQLLASSEAMLPIVVRFFLAIAYSD